MDRYPPGSPTRIGAHHLSRGWLKNHWAQRLFVVGDAAGYVEPFTGEGMAAALASAKHCAAGASASETWRGLGSRWDAIYSRMVKSRQGFAQAMSMVLRPPPLATAIVALTAVCPLLAAPFERRLNNPN